MQEADPAIATSFSAEQLIRSEVASLAALGENAFGYTLPKDSGLEYHALGSEP